MTYTDRIHDRALADMYDRVRPAPPTGPRWQRIKAWLGAFATGYAVGQVIRKLRH